MNKIAGFLLILMFQAVPALALTTGESGAPEALAAWESWVLYGHEEQYLCPADEGGPGRLCAWPVSLSLDLHQKGGRFSAHFELKKEGRFPLPGGPGAWPVMVVDQNGRTVPVLGRTSPEIWRPAGRHQISGFFSWDRLPDTIQAPLGFMPELRVDGQALDFPPLETDYASGQTRLWLKEKEGRPPEAETGPADRFTVAVTRLLQDSQPMMINSRLKLRVSGQPREVLLNNALLPGTQATFLSSPLPARLSPEGLRVRVKPGLYELRLDSRSLNQSESLGPVAADASDPEYWAFQAQNQLRLAEISGAEQIDVSQADIPSDWRSLPIYRLPPGGSLEFKTIRRGDPEPPPDRLQLARECWLDYDGGGLSCHDRLSGALSRQRHLNTSEPFTLASASLDGQPQVITWQIDSRGRPAPGLQLRAGRVDLLADLRIDDFDRRLPASGWDHQLDTEGQKLNLPPGYRLFHAAGADVRQAGSHGGAGAWTGAWTTLDFFLVLIISLAVWKLHGRPWGLLALAALIFCYHEAGAPRLVFLHLLAGTALLRLLPPTGRARWLVRTWRLLASLTLLTLSALFLIAQARLAFYPQLENPGQGYSGPSWDYADLGLGGHAPDYDQDYSAYYGEVGLAASAPVPAAAIQNSMEEMRLARTRVQKSQTPITNNRSSAALENSNFSDKMVHLSQAPDAKVQNSVPRPAWRWRSVHLYYNAGVTAEQEVELYLLGPAANRLLGLLRLALMTALTLLMLGAAGRRPDLSFPGGRDKSKPPARAAAAAALALLFLLAAPAQAQDFPDRDLLNDYRTRLLEKKPLPPPSVPDLLISAQPERLVLEFTVEAGQETVLALPTLDREIFRPEQVSLAGRDLPLAENNGRWLVLLPPGRSQMTLTGRLKKPGPNFQAFQISFPASARPQRSRVIDSPAWKIEGLDRDGQMPGGALYLSAQGLDRNAETDAAEDEGGAGVTLAPFFLVQRTLSLGLDWKVHSSVRRLTPAGAPVSLRLPLLPEESPLSGDLRLDDGRVTLNFGPQATQLSWESSLPFSSEIALKAESGPWTESWSLDVSPIWRVQHQGLAPIHNFSDGFWQPQWRPWPGESLTLVIDRPQAIPGRYLVVDRSELSLSAGDNQSLGRLQFRLRASQGGPYSFSLPAGAAVREFKVDGRSLPLSPGGGAADQQPGPRLTASLTPGEHEIEVGWDQEEKLGLVSSTPSLDLGAPAANLTATLTLPEDRWILWAWGPLQGPVVQFWPLLAVPLLAALFLGRRGSTPLGWGSWFLLGVGLIQLNILGALLVAGWLLALGRRRNSPPAGAGAFNAGQILLAVWTAAALFLIYKGIEYGLLQNPDMLVSGGGSYGQRLSWFSDRVSGPWPQGRVLSVSLWFYKALMLAWSLWLAVSVVKWLNWGWRAFSSETLWKKSPRRRPPVGPEGPGPKVSEQTLLHRR
ncbi:MAG: hypothetical protein LBP33_01205 [Candidatus Adiutrix sp.]|jgi:hypothetical protein|nr:hypothetical protein [Candidatus Adiutrix sp.]